MIKGGVRMFFSQKFYCTKSLRRVVLVSAEASKDVVCSVFHFLNLKKPLDLELAV